MNIDKQMECLKEIGFREKELHMRQVGSGSNLAVYDENEKCFVHPDEEDIEIRLFMNEGEWKTYLNFENSVVGIDSSPRKSVKDALKDLKYVYEKERSRLLKLLDKLKK